MNRDATTPERIALAEKERQALDLRKAGVTFEQIANKLGYSDRSGAAKAVRRALTDTIQEPADELRRLECERLDTLLRALWPAAISGKWLAIDRCLSIMDRRARLLGLDAPVRMKHDVITHDAFAQAVAELEAEIVELEATGDRSQPD
jgi:hypothetical protein